MKMILFAQAEKSCFTIYIADNTKTCTDER